MDRKLPALRKKELPMSRRYRLAACVLAAALAPLAADAVPFTTRFPLASCNFKTHGGNAYLRLKPGRQLYPATSAACRRTSATSSRKSGSQ
jgi:hypothetical protein